MSNKIIQKQDLTLNKISSSKIQHNEVLSDKSTTQKNQVIDLEKNNITAWTFGELPKTIQTQKGQLKITGYPALTLHENKQSCYIKIFDTQEQAQIEHIKGIKRLFTLQIKENIKKIIKDFANNPILGVNYLSLGNANDLYTQIIDSAISIAFLPNLAKLGNLNNMQILAINEAYLPKNNQEFNEFLSQGKQRFSLIVEEIKNLAMELLKSYVNLTKKLSNIHSNNNYSYAIKDMQEQLDWLISKNFLIEHSYEQLKRFSVYLQGIALRIEKLKTNSHDKIYTQQLNQLKISWQNQLNIWHKQGLTKLLGNKYLSFLNLPYMWQELRITLFAQNLKTAYPVSFKRLEKIWIDLVN